MSLAEFSKSVGPASAPVLNYAAATAKPPPPTQVKPASQAAPTAPKTVVDKLIDAAYDFASTSKAANGGGEWDLTVDDIVNAKAKWEALDGTTTNPERRTYAEAKGLMLFHLNYKGKSYHVRINNTSNNSDALAVEIIKRWPNAQYAIVH
jgi:hypothetical protein